MLTRDVEALDGEKSSCNDFSLLILHPNDMSFGRELVIGCYFLSIATVGECWEGIDVNSDTTTNGLGNWVGGGWIGRHMHTRTDASAFLGHEEVDDILSSQVEMRETVVFDRRGEGDFRKVTVLEMDGLDKFDVELLRFGELEFV